MTNKLVSIILPRLLMAILVFPTLATANSALQCQDVQTLRAQRALDWQGQMNPIVRCADRRTKTTWNKNISDLKKMEDFYKNYHVSLSYAELKGWMTPGGPYTQWLRIWNDQGRNLTGEDKTLYRWINRGSIQGFVKAMTKKNTVNALETIYRWSTYPQWKNNIVGLLFKGAGSYVSIIRFDKDRNYLTPFVAKTILFENLRMKLSPEAFNDLINQLELKVSFYHDFNKSEIPAAANHTVTVHNGYVYGSPQDIALGDNFEENNLSSAMDCSTLVQSCLEETVNEPMIQNVTRVRLSTNALFQVMERNTSVLPTSYYKFLQDNFDFEPLKSEEQLQPGDIFFVRGHMAIFGGYEKVKRKKGDQITEEWVPVTYESKGGEHRFTGRFQRYFNSQRGCEKPFLGKPGERIYILRLSNDKFK